MRMHVHCNALYDYISADQCMGLPRLVVIFDNSEYECT